MLHNMPRFLFQRSSTRQVMKQTKVSCDWNLVIEICPVLLEGCWKFLISNNKKSKRFFWVENEKKVFETKIDLFWIWIRTSKGSKSDNWSFAFGKLIERLYPIDSAIREKQFSSVWKRSEKFRSFRIDSKWFECTQSRRPIWDRESCSTGSIALSNSTWVKLDEF